MNQHIFMFEVIRIHAEKETQRPRLQNKRTARHNQNHHKQISRYISNSLPPYYTNSLQSQLWYVDSTPLQEDKNIKCTIKNSSLQNFVWFSVHIALFLQTTFCSHKIFSSPLAFGCKLVKLLGCMGFKRVIS